MNLRTLPCGGFPYRFRYAVCGNIRIQREPIPFAADTGEIVIDGNTGFAGVDVPCPNDAVHAVQSECSFDARGSGSTLNFARYAFCCAVK